MINVAKSITVYNTIFLFIYKAQFFKFLAHYYEKTKI